LTIRTGAHCTRLVLERQRAIGVEYLTNRQSRTVRAEREIVLCGGTFDSPKLLLLSGLGPAEQLRRLNISVQVDLPGVGQNLQDHLLLSVFYKSKVELPLPLFIAEAGLFVRTRPGMGAASPDLQYHFSAGVPQFIPKDYPFSGPCFAFVPVLVQPQSRGQVFLTSANPLDRIIIEPNYLQCETDLEVLLRGIELARELVQTRAFEPFRAGEAAPGGTKSREELKQYIRTHCSTIWHVVGTCKMGRDAMAVVDPQLRVHGVQGLRVADASIMPKIVAGNTHAACVMIGEKAAAMILESKG
jgi:choline dehydrogenase